MEVPTASHGKSTRRKPATSRVDDFVGVFRTLSEQHGALEALLTLVQADASKRLERWPEIRAELLSHDRAEALELYPVLRNHDPGRTTDRTGMDLGRIIRRMDETLADLHDAELRELERLIAQLDATPMASVEWGKLFDDLVDAVLAHATKEETEIFPIAQAALGEARAKELDEQFRATKARILKSV